MAKPSLLPSMKKNLYSKILYFSDDLSYSHLKQGVELRLKPKELHNN